MQVTLTNFWFKKHEFLMFMISSQINNDIEDFSLVQM